MLEAANIYAHYLNAVEMIVCVMIVCPMMIGQFVPANFFVVQLFCLSLAASAHKCQRGIKRQTV